MTKEDAFAKIINHFKKDLTFGNEKITQPEKTTQVDLIFEEGRFPKNFKIEEVTLRKTLAYYYQCTLIGEHRRRKKRS